MQIDGRPIGGGRPPYVIAELSNNHLGDPKRACRLIEIAAECGANAVKIQTYDAEALTIDCDRPEFIIKTPPWVGLNYYQLYRRIALPAEFTELLFRVARDCGITIFSSAFDERAVELLRRLNCPAYKIASFEICDDPLLRAVGATGRPVIVSTGIAGLDDIEEAIRVLRGAGCQDVALLHCISQYPANTAEMHLSVIDRLAQLNCVVGLSDHSLDNFAAVLAVARGAALIEKHFTISREDGGPDASFSLEPAELAALVKDVKRAWEAIGDPGLLERATRAGSEHGRSLFVVESMRAGDTFGPQNVRAIRPGCGLPPRTIVRILGRRARRDLARGEPLHWEDVE
ncbi:MAG TPA: pseudaminic acid synthase [Steroidobacteraceae bacterium]|nr:pseudaminic acid synthase [Steroidobacteraceae bacterium]